MKFSGFLIFPFLFLYSSLVYSQEVEINVTVIQAFSPQAKLLRYNGQQFTVVDSSMQISQGTYRFMLKEGYSRGVYRVEVGKSININFLVNNEPIIDIRTVVFAPDDSLRSNKSAENNLFWQYQREKKRYGQQIWLLRSLKDFYPKGSPFLQSLNNEEIRLQRELYSTASLLAQSNQKLLSSVYISLEQQPVDFSTDLSLPDLWWGQIDFNNPLILLSPAFKERLWAYMENFFSDDIDKEEQDMAFIKGIHQLMAIPKNIEILRALREMLIAGFADTDYVDVYDYLHYTSFGELKALSQRPKSLARKAPKTKVGQQAYNFTSCTEKGQSVTLSKVDADFKLVLFWSSWCPHCVEAMPRLRSIYDEYKDKGLEVIAISLDDESLVWLHYIKDMKLDWINIREPYSPDHQIYKIFDVHETPRMFLLSRDLTILSKPSTVRQLEVRLRRDMK